MQRPSTAQQQRPASASPFDRPQSAFDRPQSAAMHGGGGGGGGYGGGPPGGYGGYQVLPLPSLCVHASLTLSHTHLSAWSDR
jgi:hypothetical protein